MLTLSIYAQKSVTITGKVTIENEIIPDAIIELQVNSISKYSVSDKKGIYKFLNINVEDNLVLKFNYLGYKSFQKKLENLKEINEIDINLNELEIQNLNEVVIKGQQKTTATARKTSYKIDTKNFIKNAKAPEVLNTLPNVFSNEGGATVDGNLPAKIFIDGIELMTNELNKIEADDISRIEVMNNPSASYGTEFSGAVINIITKKKTPDYIKGSITASRALRFDNWYIDPDFSYKKGIFILKSYFEYKSNNQVIDYDLARFNNNDVFTQNSTNTTKGIQKSSETRINFKFSDKSNWNITNSLFGYKFIDDENGNTVLNNNSKLFFKQGESGNTNWNIASVYNYKILENKNFYIKSKYLVNDNFNNALLSYSDNSSNYYDIQSKNKDFYTALDYEAEELNFLNKKTGFYTGVKYINRKFTFSNSDFYVNQNVSNIYAELDVEWSKKFSTDLALTFETTKNSNTISLNQKYNYILPTINLIYHFKNKLDARLGYSKRILRPGANDLNSDLIIYNPGQGKQGNSNLLPQIRNYYFISFNKVFKTNNFSLKFFNENINNSIVNTYKLENDLLIQTLENAAKYNSSGMSIGIRTKLFKKINTNLNTGFDYNVYEDKSYNALIPKTEGYTFRGSISLSTKVAKDKLFLSFSGSQNGPQYSLLFKSVNYPYFDLRASTNILKDKLNISLYAGNIFGTAANFDQISSYTNFYQKASIRNKTTNLSLSITYNFGKKFNDNIDDNNINNNDIRN